MDLQKALKLIESLGDCDELFVIGKQQDTGDYIYSCTDIKDSLELAYLLEQISNTIVDSFEKESYKYDALKDILNDFDINESKN